MSYPHQDYRELKKLKIKALRDMEDNIYLCFEDLNYVPELCTYKIDIFVSKTKKWRLTPESIGFRSKLSR